MIIADSKTVRTLDAEAIKGGIPSLSLMERAAYGISDCAESILGSLFEKRIAVFCGSGNNGGDGIAFCRIARARGAAVRCYLTGAPDRITNDTDAFLKLYRAEGGKAVTFDPKDRGGSDDVLHADLIVDAMYGIGFRGILSGLARSAAALINRSDAPVVAADVPSGAEADTALISEDCVRADYTVTFTCLKAAHCVHPAKKVCGIVSVCDIGIPRAIIDDHLSECSESGLRLFSDSTLARMISKRKPDSHKGDYGKILVIGGCVGFTGAPFLAASAAFRMGPGLVYLAVPESIYAVEAPKCDEVICLPFAEKAGHFSLDALDALITLASKCDVCVLGPGMGRSADSDALVLALLERLSCPVILDADGINAASENIHVLFERSSKKLSTVLTPHDVEYGRLGGVLAEGRIRGAAALAARFGAYVVLKGNTSVTASPDGTAYINTSGNPGMAKGGSGDALSGMIASLIGQGHGLQAAAAAGVYVHGAAGDLAADRCGEYGMLPTDLIGEIPMILKQYDLNGDGS